MKKIIDVPEDCDLITFTKNSNTNGDGQWKIAFKISESISPVDLPDYTPEPLTADGLTLKEFAFKAKGNMSNVQRFDRESMGWKDCNDNLPRVVLDMVSIPEIMEIYRIKPEEKQTLSVTPEIERINKVNI